ncbi:MAG: 2-oxoacid:ferredoxin oxidoreductase subunit beta [Hyphomicrobiales bacterium]
MNKMDIETPLSPKDYASDQEVRWCPGCGDYAVLKAVQKTLADRGAGLENTVFISGIGCSSRLPYYLETYGFHTIHGRAPAVATGVKLTNPALDVWIVTGDGDGFSIGGNHMLHVLRRNVDVQILLFNNEIYGLTKGQFSPTSAPGLRTPSTPLGSLDAPVNPCAFAIGAGARFVARSADTIQKHLVEVMSAAHANKGASFVEILQNCIVYNDGVFEAETNKKTSADNTISVRHGEPLIFGKEQTKGLRLSPGGFGIDVVSLTDDGVSRDDLLIHDQTNPQLAMALAHLEPPHGPRAIGVLYCNPAESFDHQTASQIAGAKARRKTPEPDVHEDIAALLRSGAHIVER